MIKRIFLFLLWNLLILLSISILFIIVSVIFKIPITWYYVWNNLLSVFLFSLVIWFSWSFTSLFLSKWLAKKIYNINIINKENLLKYWEKELFIYNLINNLALKNNIKTPEVWFYISWEVNAFATWYSKNNSLIAVSTWLLDVMNKEEIEWVIAHEMSHILNWDMVNMTLLQWLINTFAVFLSRIIASIIDRIFKNDDNNDWPSWIFALTSFIMDFLLTFFASLLIMWFSRYREYKADEWSALLVWKEKMIKALEKLKIIQKNILNIEEKDEFATLKISNNKQWWILTLFSTHPDLESRINNLKNYNI